MSKTFTKAALEAAVALSTLSLAAPAAAQVNGMAVTEPAVAIASSQALQTGFQQINTTYAAQIQQGQTLNTQRNDVLRTLDTNNDGQLDETEQAAVNESSPIVAQINGIDQQIAAAEQPVQLARLYVISQIGQQYAAAVQQVISDRSIQVMLSPEAIVYAADGMDVTGLVVAALNTRVPTVNITPPADFQPTQATVQLFQQIQQVFALAARQQQAQAGAAAPATEGR